MRVTFPKQPSGPEAAVVSIIPCLSPCLGNPSGLSESGIREIRLTTLFFFFNVVDGACVFSTAGF